jgi:hypothetical protein
MKELMESWKVVHHERRMIMALVQEAIATILISIRVKQTFSYIYTFKPRLSFSKSASG